MSTPWFLFTPLIDVAALALWWGLLKHSRRRDNRRLRNGILFLLLAGSTVRALHHLAPCREESASPASKKNPTPLHHERNPPL